MITNKHLLCFFLGYFQCACTSGVFMPSELNWPNSELNRIDASKMIELHRITSNYIIAQFTLIGWGFWLQMPEAAPLRGSVIGTFTAPFEQATVTAP